MSENEESDSETLNVASGSNQEAHVMGESEPLLSFDLNGPREGAEGQLNVNGINVENDSINVGSSNTSNKQVTPQFTPQHRPDTRVKSNLNKVGRVIMPPFTGQEPNSWLNTLRISCESRGVYSQRDLYATLLDNLGAEKQALINGAYNAVSPFTKASQILKQHYAISGAMAFKKITSFSRNDLSPLQYYRKLVVLNDIALLTQDQLKCVFLDNLPTTVANALEANTLMPLAQMAKTADNIMFRLRDNNNINHIKQIAQTDLVTKTDCVDMITEAIRRFSLTQNDSINRHTNVNRAGNNSRGTHVQNYPLGHRYCFYHFTFKQDAYYCQLPCKYGMDHPNEPINYTYKTPFPAVRAKNEYAGRRY